VKAAWAFHECQRIGDGVVVALLDFTGHIQRGDRPQCGDGFDGAECHVVAGDRRGAGAGVAGDEARQFAVVGGLATVLVGEALPRQGGSDLRPDVVVDGGVPPVTEPGVVLAVGHCQCPLKLGFAGTHGESAAQLRGFDGHSWLGSAAQGVVGDVDGVGVQPFPEQRCHLLFVDLGTRWHRPDFLPGLLGDFAGTGARQGCKAGADPVAGGFAFGGVVLRQRVSAAFGAVGGGDLTYEIEVAVAGGELVQCRCHACPPNVLRRTLET
jgi:hypothetical protein